MCFEADYGIHDYETEKSGPLTAVSFKKSLDIFQFTPRRRAMAEFFDYDIAKRTDIDLLTWGRLSRLDRELIIEEMKNYDTRLESAKKNLEE